MPGVPGAAYANNGGKTWQGVTDDTIEIVKYVPDYGAAVNTILKAQGLFYDATDAAIANKAFEKFLNEKYQLYGRKIHVDTFQGKCQTVPPDLKCLIPEMNEMVAKYHPYAVLFSTASICSKCFAELARLKVISTGGSGFSDEFQRANSPYVYDVSMSSTRMANQFAEFWCKQMTSKGNSGAPRSSPARRTPRRTSATDRVSSVSSRRTTPTTWPRSRTCSTRRCSAAAVTAPMATSTSTRRTSVPPSSSRRRAPRR